MKITHTAAFRADGRIVEMVLIRDVLSGTNGMVFSQELTILSRG